MTKIQALNRFKKLGVIREIELPKGFETLIEVGLFKAKEQYILHPRSWDVMDDIGELKAYGFHPTKLYVRGKKYIHEFWDKDVVLDGDRYSARSFYNAISPS